MSKRAIRTDLCCLLANFVFIFVTTGELHSGPEDESASKEEPAPLADAFVNGVRPATEEESFDFADDIALGINEGDVAGLNDLIDRNALLKRATKGFGQSDEILKARSEFSKGFISVAPEKGWFAGVSEAVGEDGNYDFLQSRVVNGERRVLFRMLSTNGDLNYHDYVVACKKVEKTQENAEDEIVVALDVHIMAAGERLSESIRRQFLPSVRKALRGNLDPLTAHEYELIKNIPNSQNLYQAWKDRNFAGVQTAYEALPARMKRNKAAMLVRVRACANLSEVHFQAAVADFQRTYPDDPSLDLHAIDIYFKKKEFGTALDVVDRLDKSIGGDPQLKVVAAYIYLEQKMFEKAQQSAKAALAAEPDLIRAYSALIRIALIQKDFKETATLLSTVGEEFEMTFDDLTAIADYAEFAKSPEYAEWVKTHPPDKDE